jgi:hypothetical protein
MARSVVRALGETLAGHREAAYELRARGRIGAPMGWGRPVDEDDHALRRSQGQRHSGVSQVVETNVVGLAEHGVCCRVVRIPSSYPVQSVACR